MPDLSVASKKPTFMQNKSISQIKHDIPQEVIDIMIIPYHSHAEIEYERDPESIVYTEDNVLLIVDMVIKDTIRKVNEFYRTEKQK